MAGIQVLRKAAHVSRSQLAERAGIGRFKVWQFETSRSDPSPAEVLALREALLALVRERSTRFHLVLQQQSGT